MTLDEIERAISLAKARGLAELECAIGQGGRLRVIVNRPQKPTPLVVTAAKRTERRPAIRTDYFGVFADTHPAVKEGDHVAEHQIVGFLELGDIRFAIEAGRAGRIARRHVQPGDLVGYGETVFDYD
jgi:biotin carboxyl carrier protein